MKDNAVWLVPVLVAVVSGLFYLIKKSGNHNKQSAKNISDSPFNQVNGDQIIQGGNK